MDRMIYLDHAATTRPFPETVEAMLPFYGKYYGNASSGYELGEDSKEAANSKPSGAPSAVTSANNNRSSAGGAAHRHTSANVRQSGPSDVQSGRSNHACRADRYKLGRPNRQSQNDRSERSLRESIKNIWDADGPWITNNKYIEIPMRKISKDMRKNNAQEYSHGLQMATGIKRERGRTNG